MSTWSSATEAEAGLRARAWPRVAVACLATLIGLWFLAAGTPVRAEVRLPRVFGSHMVLQRDRPIRVWGWADVGEEIRVTIAGRQATTQADDDGRWRVAVPGLAAGGPHVMTVAGENTVRCDDVLVGEVWLCSGQSNMWRPLYWPQRKWGVVDYQREIAAADYPRLRLLNVSRVPGEDHPNPPRAVPADDVRGRWSRCTPEVAANFSAVAHFFGRTLLEELDVPVGVINASYGGSKIEAWLPRPGDGSLHDPNKEVTRHSRSSLYHSMVHPLLPVELGGFLWYQGESNIGDGRRYRAKMESLISGWRKAWGREDLPFYFVQLPPFRYGGDPYRLPRLREAQAAALALPHTGMVVTLDLGDLKDIHPRKKKQVGGRLARLALAKTYGVNDLPYSGPVYRSMRVAGNKVHVEFDHAGGKLSSRDGKPLSWFEIAGSSGRFVAAEARIDGTAVVVHHPSIVQPRAVRYAWHEAAQPNLVNRDGLPAAPFRTGEEDN